MSKKFDTLLSNLFDEVYELSDELNFFKEWFFNKELQITNREIIGLDKAYFLIEFIEKIDKIDNDFHIKKEDMEILNYCKGIIKKYLTK